MHEFELIERLLAPLASHPGARALRDDGAVISPGPGTELAVTKDVMAEGVHFLPDDPPGTVARKLLRVNLSDLAAMGARPVGYLLGLASDGRRSDDWYRAFAAGLAGDQEEFSVGLLGGDTVAAAHGVLTLSLTAMGEIPRGLTMARGGAFPGDLVAVSGTIGDAALGLLAGQGRLPRMDAAHRAALQARYRLPEPRLALGRALLGTAHAAIDVSDGLLADAGHLGRCSGVSIAMAAADVPLSDAAAAAVAGDPDLVRTVVSGGDDYELLLALAPEDLEMARRAAAACGTPLSVIGRCGEGSGVCLVDAEGLEMDCGQTGWRHAV